MDVYHKVLVEVYNLTGGDTNETVNLLDIVKKAGFFPSYKEIIKELSYRSWIYEAKDNKVKLTHWGVDEAKKSLSRAPDANQNFQKDVNRLSAETNEFADAVEKFSVDNSPEKIGVVEKKLIEISNIIEEIKANF